jgi:hypothetical protein
MKLARTSVSHSSQCQYWQTTYIWAKSSLGVLREQIPALAILAFHRTEDALPEGTTAPATK